MSALPADARGGRDVPPADRVAALALALVPGVGTVRWRAALATAAGDAGRALAAVLPSRADRVDAIDHAAHQLARSVERGAELHLLGEASYPAPLRDLADPPPALWSLGAVDVLTRAPRVAVVGTRDMTPYGARAARAVAGALARAGALIVSGMARGVDAIAHEAALEAGARTTAVLGTGADVAYPSIHRALHRRIVASGLVLSERPPGAAAAPGAFPRRNRLIAALADLTIVVEAGHKSGALITSGVALELGRAVAAVPGPIDAATSAGTNALLRDGAQLVATPDDALALVGLLDRPTRLPADTPVEPPPGLNDDERTVWLALSAPALDPDALIGRTSLPARRGVAALGALELAGLVVATVTGELRRA